MYAHVPLRPTDTTIANALNWRGSQMMKQQIRKEERTARQHPSAERVPPVAPSPRPRSPRSRYYRLPPTPSSRGPDMYGDRRIMRDTVPQPASSAGIFDEGPHCSARASDRSQLATPGRIVVGQSHSPRWNSTVQQHDFSPHASAAKNVVEFRRGRGDQAIFTAYMNDAVRKHVDLSATGHC